MRTLRLLVFISSCTLVLSQQQSPNIKSPHPYNFAAASQRTRRLQGSVEQKRISFSPLYSGSRASPNSRKTSSKKNGVPSYAVQMEPLVQYSQPDPLYSIEKQYLSEAKPLDSSTNDLIKKDTPGPMVADITEAESISRLGQITHARFRPPTHLSPPPMSRPHNHHHHHHHHGHQHKEVSYGMYYEGPPEAFEPPEPIIEIIIKESNESLPAPPPLPTPPPPKKTKEPVQVFYVKYKQEPGYGYGAEDKIVYDAPIPAVTPPANHEDPQEEEHEPEPVVESIPEDVTVAPPPSTTLKAIIRPDSETFDAKGVHISFGAPEEPSQDEHPPPYGQLEQQSAPRPAIAFPNGTPKPSISRSSNGGGGAVSTLTKRNPAPFNGPANFQPSFPQPSAPTTFQQTPQFPPQDFQPPPIDPSQYSTLPQNFQYQRPQQPAAPQIQRYTTINNAPPAQQQYHTINLPQNNPSFQSFPQQQNQQHFQQQQQRPQIPQDQHQRQVEQVNRLQHQQQLLQQQLSQQHRFQQQPFSQQPQFVQQPSQQPPQQQFVQQPSQQQQFVQQPSQQQQFVQQPQQNHFLQQTSQSQNQHFQTNPQQYVQQPQYRQPPQLSYNQSPDIVKSLEQASNIQNHRHESVSTFAPASPSPSTRLPTPTTPSYLQQYRTTSTSTTTEVVTEIVTEDPQTIERKKKKKEEQVQKNVADLPDEVPDDLREQLLSSGILGNADIQILDYDKIGDIPLENLPPEALANFQQATSGSQRVTVVRRPDSAQDREDEDSALSSSEYRPVTFTSAKTESASDMEMKVVRFNPDEDEDVADRYMKKGATQLAPVVLNDNKYNRYLPLQVSGAQFPVPDVPELRGRNVTSVVVLAPVDYEFLNRRDVVGDDSSETRVGRSAAPVLEVQGVHFVAGDVLKTLVRMPSTENYRRWLEKEKKTVADKQSVVLLVLEPDSNHPEKEIYMYDIASGRVSKLRGELSSTFVQVAASNSHNQDLEEIADNPLAPAQADESRLPSR